MKNYPTKIIKLITTTFVLFLFFSCETDSDLLTDMVLEDAIVNETSINVNDAKITVEEDKATSFNMLNNATSKGSRRQYKSSKQPKNGGLVIQKDSIAVYTPDYDFNGKDAIEITLEETSEDNTTSDVTMIVEVTVNPTADVVDDKVETTQGTALLIEPLKNDNFNENSNVRISQTSNASKGSIVINEDNTLTYTPNSGTTGIDLFTYTTEVTNLDESKTTETGEITVTINSTGNSSSSTNTGDMGPLKAFPTAYGGGSDVTGGRGGKVIHVTNLNASGSGSLKAALETSGSAIIVFDVSGVIRLPIGGWLIRNITDKTVLGQTAPKGGITLTGGKFRIENSRNLIIRYIRSRPILNKNGIISSDDDANTAAFLFHGINGLMLDHVSASFAQDKAINMFNVANNETRNITVSNSLISDSNSTVTFGVNPSTDGRADNADNISFIYNLIGNSSNRTPNMSFNGYGEIMNNVIFGGSSRLSNVYYNLKLNHIGNYYPRWSGAPVIANKYQSTGSGTPSIYTKENYYTGKLNGTTSEDNSGLWEHFSSTAKLGTSFFRNSIHPRTVPNPSPILTPQNAYDFVISNVGANKYINDEGSPITYIDDYDQSVINNVKNKIRVNPKNIVNWTLPILPNLSRSQNYDSDNDGLADAWEQRTFGNLNKSHDDPYGNEGYTVIEAFAYQVDFN